MRHALATDGLRIVVLIVTAAVLAGTPAQAGFDDALIRILIKKGILTEEEVQALKQEAAEEEGQTLPREVTGPASPEPQPTPREQVDELRDEIRQELTRRDKETIALSAKVEGEGRWRAYKDVGNRTSGSTSDLFLRRAELGAEFRPVDYLVGRLVLTSEWLGAQTTDQGQPVDASVSIDEATIKLASEDWPVYGIGGKRTQPFGAFFSHLVTDPMTQDAYEVKQVGGTVGVTPGIWGADLSVTLYPGEEQMDHFFQSGLFDSSAVVRSTTAGLRQETDHVNSFILAATASPVKDLTLGAAYLSEPGDGRRNQTGAIWVGYTWGRVTAEAEFAAALSRERYVLQSTGARLGESFLEKILAVGLSYKPVAALELAMRYARLWDGGLANQAQIWSARDRLSVGAGYTLFERGDIAVRLMGEYRFTDYRRGGAARDVAAPDQHEAFLKLAVSYR